MKCIQVIEALVPRVEAKIRDFPASTQVTLASALSQLQHYNESASGYFRKRHESRTTLNLHTLSDPSPGICMQRYFPSLQTPAAI